MRQKVVIACGLVRDAPTLLFDEPLTGLDPVGIRRMRETIVARARAGAAILLSSHLLHLVEEICTRVIIMDRGRKMADGTVAELASRADLAAAGSNLEQIFLRVTGHDRPTGGQRAEPPRDARAPPSTSSSARRGIGCGRRLRRLREPRYLVGGIAGLSYLVFTLFIRQRAYGRAGRSVRDAGASGSGSGGSVGRSSGLYCRRKRPAGFRRIRQLGLSVRQRASRVLACRNRLPVPFASDQAPVGDSTA